MKKGFAFIIIVLVGCCMCVAACAKKEDAESEQGKIEQITDQIAHDAAEGIKEPLNKARNLQDMAKKRIKEFEEKE